MDICRIYKVIRLSENRTFSKVWRDQKAKISAGHHNKIRNVMQHEKLEDVGTNLAILSRKKKCFSIALRHTLVVLEMH